MYFCSNHKVCKCQNLASTNFAFLSYFLCMFKCIAQKQNPFSLPFISLHTWPLPPLVLGFIATFRPFRESHPNCCHRSGYFPFLPFPQKLRRSGRTHITGISMRNRWTSNAHLLKVYRIMAENLHALAWTCEHKAPKPLTSKKMNTYA